jgi:DNA mismatch repair ATPase MutL
MKVNSKTAASLFFRSASLEFVYFEAIANSIDSGSSDITVAVDIDSFSEPESLKISILDNGKGFDDENYSRFCMLLEGTSKNKPFPVLLRT